MFRIPRAIHLIDTLYKDNRYLKFLSIRTGEILKELTTNKNLIVAGYLSFVLSTTDYTNIDIRKHFGKKVARYLNEINNKFLDINNKNYKNEDRPYIQETINYVSNSERNVITLYLARICAIIMSGNVSAEFKEMAASIIKRMYNKDNFEHQILMNLVKEYLNVN